MPRKTTGSEFNSQIHDEASTWFVEVRAGDLDAAARQRFDAWLRRSPEHVRAYLEVSEIWDDAGLVNLRESQNTTASLIARALEGADLLTFPASAERVPAVRQGSDSSKPPGGRLRGWSFPAAAAALLICVMGAYIGWARFGGQIYATDVGEQRIITLADGSTVQLNSHSRLRVRMTTQQRKLDLEEGQALFDVAHDAARPFLVESGNVTVRAVGTRFDVDRMRSATTVTVVRGVVAVYDPERGGARSPRPDGGAALPEVERARQAEGAILLREGEQIRMRPRASDPLPHRIDVAAVTAWTQHTLVFQGTRLADVIEDFNRDNRRPLVLSDPALEELRISGIYSSTDPTLLIRFLREQPGIAVEETLGAVMITSTKK
jgi:transmembrane sensor